jgi:hypothetical protein
VETAVKKSVLVETQGRIFLALQPFQTSNSMPKMLVHADFCRNQPYFYSKLVEKQWKQL